MFLFFFHRIEVFCLRIHVKDDVLKTQFGHFVWDDDIVILPSYRVVRIRYLFQSLFMLCFLVVLGVVLFLFLHLPSCIEVKPIEPVYAIEDNSAEHYKVSITSIFGSTYETPFANIDVRFGVGDNLDVRASLFHMFHDTIRVVPIAQKGAYAEYTKPVYEGDKLKKKYVRTFLRFVDGHEIEQDWKVMLPKEPVVHPVKIGVQIEQFHRFYVDVRPIMRTGVSATYAESLYEGDTFDMSKVSWVLSYEDGFERKIKDVTANVDVSVVGKEVVLHAVCDYYEGDVVLPVIELSELSAVYHSNQPLYEGDMLEKSNVSVTAVWSDGRVRELTSLEYDLTGLGRLLSNTAVLIPTNFGSVVLGVDVIGVESVVVDGGQVNYTEGDVISPMSFQIYYQDGTDINVWTDSVSLGDEWYQPLSAGDNALTLVYHDIPYVCHVNAAAKPVVPLENDDEYVDDSEADVNHQEPGVSDLDGDSNDATSEIDVQPDVPSESTVSFPPAEPDDGIGID